MNCRILFAGKAKVSITNFSTTEFAEVYNQSTDSIVWLIISDCGLRKLS